MAIRAYKFQRKYNIIILNLIFKNIYIYILTSTWCRSQTFMFCMWNNVRCRRKRNQWEQSDKFPWQFKLVLMFHINVWPENNLHLLACNFISTYFSLFLKFSKRKRRNNLPVISRHTTNIQVRWIWQKKIRWMFIWLWIGMSSQDGPWVIQHHSSALTTFLKKYSHRKLYFN